jgi:hypothetical protein
VPLRAGSHSGWPSSLLELLLHVQLGLVVAPVVGVVGPDLVFGGNLFARVVVASPSVGHVVQGVCSCWRVAWSVVRGPVGVLPRCLVEVGHLNGWVLPGTVLTQVGV